MPINPFGAAGHTVSCQEQPFCTRARESETQARAHTHTEVEGAKEGGSRGGGWFAAGLASMSTGLKASWGFNNFPH